MTTDIKRKINIKKRLKQAPNEKLNQGLKTLIKKSKTISDLQ